MKRRGGALSHFFGARTSILMFQKIFLEVVHGFLKLKRRNRELSRFFRARTSILMF
ncbi:hypothetical protein KP002_19510 [Geomonas subterranea]|uniref:hypothetical protein n=1 Tax=Geomonas subterranea TaxID=2847989 RepID=UPI001C44C968|nr:hypothetical protein [Geomonas subterranea]QXM09119.1 hypothetical protein KP002_19510 [Geomonas subterranea]